MLEKRTAPKVLRLLKIQELRIPRRDHFGDILWRQLTTTQIISILRNPAYAGAFAYGWTRTRHANGVPPRDGT